LVYDKTGAGSIDSGLKLIGQVTFWVFWKNGYEVLSALDDNHDGKLSGNELDHLGIWNDTNSDGIAQNGEVKPLSYWHIRELSCAFDKDSTGHVDTNDTNDSSKSTFLRSADGVAFQDGAHRPTYDVLIDEDPITHQQP
jgi:hypothetical protein